MRPHIFLKKIINKLLQSPTEPAPQARLFFNIKRKTIMLKVQGILTENFERQHIAKKKYANHVPPQQYLYEFDQHFPVLMAFLPLITVHTKCCHAVSGLSKNCFEKVFASSPNFRRRVVSICTHRQLKQLISQ